VTGLIELAALTFEVSDLMAWRKFAIEVLGIGVAEHRADRLRFKLDVTPWRIEVVEGPADDLARLSWRVAGSEALDRVSQRLRDHGTRVQNGTEAECQDRGCEGLVRFRDPAGTASELVYGVPTGQQFHSDQVPSGFVTGEQGMGHAVIAASNTQESVAFYCDVLGFKVSDYIKTSFHRHVVDLTFLRCNSRHHSVAMPCPPPRRIHHFLLEVNSLDDVGAALDRALGADCRIINVLGRHPNDQMLSFYAETPSGFQFEFGWGGRTIDAVDDENWTIETYDRISDWGHTPPAFLRGPRRKK
jgi:2,3-dihydroxybiphenyl 1,2-dioxygenase